MSQRATIIRIPEPCPESWAAMTPASGGRHCTACQKTVVDFTLKTDAEILAYFQQAGAAAPCGRFRASQLARPLLPAAPARPAQRWRGWVAAALALWGLRAEAAAPPAPQPLSAQHPRRKPAPARPTRQVARRLVRGVVRDEYSQQPVAQAHVRLQGGHQVATTDANGYFRLWLPAQRGPHRPQRLVVRQVDYRERTVRVPLAARSAQALRISLTPSLYAPDLNDDMTSGISVHELMEVYPDASTAKPDTLAPPVHLPRRSWYQRLTQPFRYSTPTR
jgi:hypothetical protein